MAQSISFVLIVIVSFLMGCTGGSSSSDTAVAGGSVSAPSPGSPFPTPVPPSYQMYPLSWETRVSGSQLWSTFLFDLILDQATSLMNGSSDVANFCTHYFSMSSPQKANFWAYLISEIALFESAYDPTSRFVEASLGTDPVTGQQVVSEGLLQLSYQDKLNYPFCQFDWSTDSKLAPTDPNKTIFNPDINLHCGALILNTQVKNHNLIEIGSGAYWSTLKVGSQYNKLTQIKAATQQLPFCMGL